MLNASNREQPMVNNSYSNYPSQYTFISKVLKVQQANALLRENLK